MTKEKIIECCNIVKYYDQGPQKVEVLKGLDLIVHAGERVAIVGASGAGKSTLLNVLGGLDRPNEGEVRINNKAISTMSENERGRFRNQNLGFVYQFHHLLGEFSARENVAMPLLISGQSKKNASDKADAILARVGLENRVEHKPAELSGGERQRVAIARALVNEPACVLMDEPTGNLDAGNAKAIQALMLELSKVVKTAFVVVTHDADFAQTLNAVYELHEGILRVTDAA